ncbi:helix-turn-helix transcriptional regulator [Nonomuraea longicatena]|uniref:Helix-turn-helix transcriptional regulator n=1 Tax=Nonomuraea longicatena TaxID=83682 RepID=A0ABN1PAN9_9ACTN
MTAPETAIPSGTPLEMFGFELRRCRMERHFSINELARAIAFSASLVGAVERAARRPTRDFTMRCEGALGLSGELLEILPLITKETSPGWFRPWAKIEEAAESLRSWEPLVIPGLLQTERYARAVLQGKPGISAEDLEQSIEARLQRQAIFHRPNPPMFSAILDEWVLKRPIGGGQVMREQLEHLLTMTSHHRVTIQIVPTSLGVTAGLQGGFIIAPQAAYIETSVAGYVSDRPDELSAININYDTIRAWAHPQHVSEDLIREMVSSYDRDSIN